MGGGLLSFNNNYINKYIYIYKKSAITEGCVDDVLIHCFVMRFLEYWWCHLYHYFTQFLLYIYIYKCWHWRDWKIKYTHQYSWKWYKCTFDSLLMRKRVSLIQLARLLRHFNAAIYSITSPSSCIPHIVIMFNHFVVWVRVRVFASKCKMECFVVLI
jgi:hypothetical protein